MSSKKSNLDDEFRNWNPMRDAFNNEEFNSYDVGPGSQLVHQNNVKQSFVVITCNNPNINKKVIYNLCARHAKVLQIRQNAHKHQYFVHFQTIGDVEAVHRALNANNEYGFTIAIGRMKREDQQNKENKGNNAPDAKEDKIVAPELNIRKYHTSQKLHPRPHVEDNVKQVVVKHPGRNDGGYTIDSSDAHDLERSGLPYPKTTWHGNLKYNYSLGRACHSIPKATTDFLETKARESQGKFHKSLNCYSNTDDPQVHRPKNLGKCFECSTICDTVCARCSTYICSKECQRMSWEKHRLQCGKPNKQLESSIKESRNLDSSLSKLSQFVSSPSKPFIDSIAMPAKNSIVCITSISKANIVFIRPHNDEFNKNFLQFMSELQSLSMIYEKLKAPPKDRELVIGCLGNIYHRCMVFGGQRPDGRVTLIYVDYGNINTHPWKDLYQIPEQYKTSIFLANPVVLRGVKDTYLTPELKIFLYSQLEEVLMKVKYDEEKDLLAATGIYSVELVNCTSGESLNTKLIQLSIPQPPKAEDGIVLYYNYLEQQYLTCGENIDVVVMDNSLLNSGSLSCTMKEYAVEIQKFQKDIQSYAEVLEEKEFCPRIDELCIAKYAADGKWYRGRCIELLGDGFPTILFVDYGNVASVSIKHIQPYPEQFTYPIYTCDCDIAGFPEDCSDELISKLEELIPNGKTLHCDHVAVNKEENFHTLTLKSIIDQVNQFVNVK